MRKKLDLAYIANDSMRKSTFNKRKKGVVKKIHELSVLCGIDACAVIYSPFNSRPEVWPSTSGAKKVVEKFEMLPEVEQEKKMVNHETFLQQSISRTMENNNRKMKDNAARTIKEAMFHLLEGKGNNLMLGERNREDLCKCIDEYLKQLHHHKNVTLNQSRFEYGESSSAGNFLVPNAIAEVGSSSFSNINAINSAQLGNELWPFGPMFSLNQRQEQVHNVGSNLLSTAAGQVQGYYPTVNPATVYDQTPNLNTNHNQYQHQFGYSAVGQDGINNPNQINQQEDCFFNQMMNYPGEVDFRLTDENNRY